MAERTQCPKIEVGAKYKTNCPYIGEVRIISERARAQDASGKIVGKETGYCAQEISTLYKAPIFLDWDGNFDYNGEEYHLTVQTGKRLERYIIRSNTDKDDAAN